MGYTLLLTQTVEALGARWTLRTVDKAMGRIASAAALAGVKTVDSAAVAPELVDPLCDLFTQGVVAWEGVLDETGQEIPCTHETVAAVPTLDKLVVATEYLMAQQALAQKKGPVAVPLMSSSPPAASSAEAAT